MSPVRSASIGTFDRISLSRQQESTELSIVRFLGLFFGITEIATSHLHDPAIDGTRERQDYLYTGSIAESSIRKPDSIGK